MVSASKKITRKLAFKIPLKVVFAIAVMIVFICVFLNIYLTNLQQRSVMNNINAVAENNAYLASGYLNNLKTVASTFSKQVYQYKTLDAGLRDQLIRKDLASYLDDERIFSAYIALEPNSLFENTPSGRSYYEYRDGNTKRLDVADDYDTYKDGEYYAVSKQTGKAHITEPYTYKLSNGNTVWLITISSPIVDGNGKFLGVVTADILTDTINNLDYNLGGYTTSDNYILSTGSVYVSDTADKKKSGTKYSEKADNSVFKVSQPLKIDGIESKWTSNFTVGKSEALKDVSMLTLLISLVGIIGILIIGFVIILIIRRSLAPVNKIVTLSQEMGNGNLNSDIHVDTQDELGELAAISKETSQRLSEYVSEISQVLTEISNGNLKVDVTRDYVGDFSPIKKALVKIIDSLNIAFSEIGTAAIQVSTGAEEIANGAQSLSNGATEQAGSLEELSASIDEVSQKVKLNANNANNARILAEDAQRELEIGKETIGEMMAAITEIRDTSMEITKIIKTIDDIAFQTNILSLNAAVEAARAGSAGKGFAVVADEVRNLASKSAEAAKHTTTLIDNSVNAVENGTKIAAKTAELLNLIVAKFTDVNNLVTEIADASNEQASSISQIDTGVSQISSVVQMNSATAEESAASSEELSAQANLLKERVAKFELKTDLQISKE
ncbi:HAMP domain-containing protein [Caproiciproducens galactitolivorans]|uniref:Methyl-accepting chemotaxis protein IV n=2 Tax=Caproiciproducens galactitolivorans TaxID=642589 RepID=A0A4Z0YAV7_9FIRM|nr:HAMP domain-containing protein [Caproiciproducens galactitolivorans]TGJ76100.1 methyl-accepting chemotaxis protein IV [Caproiciproducens galactitolivorans]